MISEPDRSAARRRYFRRWPRDRDPRVLLRPDEQQSTPWGEPEHGPCDKCGGSGRARFRCRSCLHGPRSDCPACGGRTEYVDVCPTCEGDGQIDRTTRDGVSVFPTIDGLYHYIAEREAEADGYGTVELEGYLTDDRDLDADAGALLIHPTRVVAMHPFDGARLARLKKLLEQQSETRRLT
jgi:hypothetical protein